ncbi:MAG TPA: hypothetical protein ENH02_01665 [Bacteroidetes bacterium]|nr:hypothetical protein [Bacteroidota bacterium]
MSNKKSNIKKGMEKIMLDCDHATYLVTKRDYESLNCIQKMQLKLHLASCKFCRMFAEQNKIISETINDIKVVDREHLHVHLNEEQKSKLKKTIESDLTKGH